MCRHLPMDVVTWNVVLPSGREVKGTAVGETRPIVCQNTLANAAQLALKRMSCPEWSENLRGWTADVCAAIGDLLALGKNVVMYIHET